MFRRRKQTQEELNERFISAARIGNIKELDSLIAQGVSKDAVDVYGNNAALNAAWNGQQEMYAYLIKEHGFSRDAVDKYGNNAALNAARSGNQEMYDYLIKEHGFSRDAVDNNGSNAALIAALNGKQEMYDYLIKEHGFSRDAVDNNGWNAALIAALNGKQEMYAYLIKEHGFSIDVVSKVGDNALTLASYNGKKAMVIALVEEYGFDLSFKGEEGLTGEEWARKRGHAEIANYLEGKAKDLIGSLEEKKSSILPRTQDFPRAAVGMLAKGSQVAQRRGTFDNILVNLTRQELATLRANIANLQDLSALSKEALKTNSLEVRQLLQTHVATLKEIATTHVSSKQARSAFEQAMQNPQAEAYYMSIISNLNGAYVATSSVKSGIIDHDKVGILGNVGKVISAVSEVIPIGGIVTKVLGSVLSGVDAAKQKTRLNRLANLSGSVVDFDAIAKSVANELVKQKRHVNGGAGERDIETMLKAIFEGKVLPSNNIAGELVEIVTGAQVVLPDILVRAESVGFAGRNSPRLNLRATQTPSPDHSDAIAQILARQANLEAELAATKAESSKTKEELARTQKKLSRQEEKTKSLSRVVSPNAENDGDAVGGGFVRRLANADPAQGRQMIADYHHGMHERIGGIAAVAGQNQDHVESHTERLDRLEQQLAEANRKNKNKDRCVTM